MTSNSPAIPTGQRQRRSQTRVNNVDIDRLVNYREEYTSVIQKHKITGDSLIGLCPFHEDSKESFSVDLKTGQWHCFAEDEGGNFVSFWARLYNMDTKDAYRAILEKYGVWDSGKAEKPKTKTALVPYSAKQYSYEKHLPIDFLEQTCRVTTAKERDGTTYLRIPYLNEDGQEATFRKRFGNKEFRWRKDSTGKICLYGA